MAIFIILMIAFGLFFSGINFMGKPKPPNDQANQQFQSLQSPTPTPSATPRAT